MNEMKEEEQRSLVVSVVAEATPEERQILLLWGQQLLEIKNSDLSAYQKAKRSVEVTIRKKTIWPFIKAIGRELKRVGWDDRGLAARVGLSAAAFAAVVLSGKGAGIAAMGGAIGVPLWVVFGAGGVFVGTLIEEITKKNAGAEESGGGDGSTIN